MKTNASQDKDSRDHHFGPGFLLVVVVAIVAIVAIFAGVPFWGQITNFGVQISSGPGPKNIPSPGTALPGPVH